MENLLKDKVDELAKKLAEEITKRAQQAMPDLSAVKDMANKIKKTKVKEKFENAVSECRERAEQQVTQAIADGTQIVESYKSDLNSLGSSLGQLVVGTAQFAARIAMIPPAIISATPMGPGVSANLVAPMLQDLKAEGDILSKVYDDTFNYRNKVRLDQLASAVPALNAILTVHDSTAALVKPLITMVGASCDGEVSNVPEVEPPISYDYKATECDTWDYKYELGKDQDIEDIEPTVDNCKFFSAIFEANGVNCNNCKNYR